MVLNNDYNPEAEDDDWSVVSDAAAQAEVSYEEVPMESVSATTQQATDSNVDEAVADLLSKGMDSLKHDMVVQDTIEDNTTMTNDPEPEEQTPFLSTTVASNCEIESTEEPSISINSHEEGSEDTPQNNNNHNHHAPPDAPASSSTRHSGTATAAVGDWLRQSLTNVGARLQEIDQKHQLQQKARSSIKQVEASLKNVERTVDETSHRLAQKLAESDLPTKARELEDRTKHAAHVLQTKAHVVGQQLQTSAAHAGRHVQEISEKVPVAQVVAVAAVAVAGAVLVAKGKPAAGAAVWATGGAAVAAAEVVRQQNQHRSNRQYSEGLNEDLHLD